MEPGQLHVKNHPTSCYLSGAPLLPLISLIVKIGMNSHCPVTEKEALSLMCKKHGTKAVFIPSSSGPKTREIKMSTQQNTPISAVAQVSPEDSLERSSFEDPDEASSQVISSPSQHLDMGECGVISKGCLSPLSFHQLYRVTGYQLCIPTGE